MFPPPNPAPAALPGTRRQKIGRQKKNPDQPDQAQGLNRYPICGAHTIAQLKAAFALGGTAFSAAAARWLNLEMDVPPEPEGIWLPSPVRP